MAEPNENSQRAARAEERAKWVTTARTYEDANPGGYGWLINRLADQIEKDQSELYFALFRQRDLEQAVSELNEARR